MDIYLTATVQQFQNLLEKKKFSSNWKKNHFSAMQYDSGGRYHILFLELDGKVFCDFHYDNKIHGIGMGADYGKRPENYFEKNLKNDLEKMKIKYQIKQVNWFTRRNKAIITGFRQ